MDQAMSPGPQTDPGVLPSEPVRRPPPPPPPPPADEIGVGPTVSSPAVKMSVPVTPVQQPAAAPVLASAPVPPPVPLAPEPADGDVPMELNLEPALLDFLFSPAYRASVEAVTKTFGFDDETTEFINDLDRLVMAKKIDVEGYLAALEDELKTLSPAQKDELYARLLAERFLPLGDFLKPSAQEVARLEELKLPAISHYQVYFKPLTYSGAATEVASAAGFSIMGGPIRERLRELVISKLKGVRVDAQVVDTLTRGIDFGGLGLDKKTADQALRAMNDILARAKVMSEEDYANWLADEARRKAGPAVVASPSAPMSADDEEIAKIQANMPQPVIDTSSELAKAVETTLQRLTYRPTDDYLAKRLRNVLSSRLRDVRSAIEIKQLLMRDIKVGGLGLDATQAEDVSKQIEAAYQEFHVAITNEEKTKIESQLEDQKRKIGERRRQEAEEHAKWFEEKIRARKAGETQKSQVVDDMRRVMNAGPTSPVDIKEQRVETAKFGPLIPAQGLVNPMKPDVTAPTRPEVKVSPATVDLAQATAGARPSMDGVVYGGPQLVGLVGELKTLTVAEFRRLSKNPQDASAKVRQKIETLAQESFEKRVEGIRAFQASPLQEAYMALVGESFRTAKPVVALADEKRKAGGDSLSPDEIGAIIQLNSALHF